MKLKLFLTMGILAASLSPLTFAQSADSGTSTLGVTVGPEATFSSVAGSTTLSAANTKFGGYSGTTNFSYKIRTSQTSGSGSITVEVTAFGTNGPAVADLSYTCSGASSGTACSSSTPASTSTATSVVSFSSDAHSADSGDSGSASWNLVDRTNTKTGNYTSTATFTISAS